MTSLPADGAIDGAPAAAEVAASARMHPRRDQVLFTVSHGSGVSESAPIARVRSCLARTCCLIHSSAARIAGSRTLGALVLPSCVNALLARLIGSPDAFGGSMIRSGSIPVPSIEAPDGVK